jgi:hypothetical protein
VARGLADREVIGPIFSPACYLEGSARSLMYLVSTASGAEEGARAAGTLF